ncbi:MAG TPA: TIM barrel protein [Thermomicrobiales bacterium]|nr:TIM barrel protein [Thermomicrobiales bacterium]
MPDRYQLASAPINWGIGPVTPEGPAPDDILDAIVEAGYVGCELGTYGLFGTTAEEVMAKFRPRNLALVTTWHEVDMARPLADEAAAEFRHLLEILVAGGASVILVSDLITDERLAVVARVDDHPETWWREEEWTQVRQTLLDVAAIAVEYGVQVAIHPHVGGHVESGAEIRRVLDLTASTPVNLCLDTGHIRIGGSDPIALLDREGDRLVHVHAKDVDGEVLGRLQRSEIEFFDAVGAGLFADLGSGSVDWQGLKRGLEACGYRGWVVAEQDRLLEPGNPEPYASNRRNFDFLNGLLNR